MSKVVDLGEFRSRKREPEVVAELDSSNPDNVFWLAGIVKENLGKNLKRIEQLLGEKAVTALVNRKVNPVILTLAKDTEPFGFVSIYKDNKEKTVSLCVTNNFTKMFLDTTKDLQLANGSNMDYAGLYAALFSAGALVASSVERVQNIGRKSKDIDLWDRVSVGNPVDDYFRFAGGVVCEIMGTDPSAFRSFDDGEALSPQLAGMINPLNLTEMLRSFSTTYNY